MDAQLGGGGGQNVRMQLIEIQKIDERNYSNCFLNLLKLKKG